MRCFILCAVWCGWLCGWCRGQEPLTKALESITTDEIKKHVVFLASDTLQGREAGTQGNHAAGTFLVQKLKQADLQPAGDEGSWFQYFNGNMRNILAVLAEAGGGAEHIASLTWYVTDRNEYLNDLPAVGAAYREVIGRNYPAMAVVAVTALMEAQAKVEIEATAVLPDEGT